MSCCCKSKITNKDCLFAADAVALQYARAL
jgi:hypothetical protein